MKNPDFNLFENGGFTDQFVCSLSAIWKEKLMKDTLNDSQDVDFYLSDGIKL